MFSVHRGIAQLVEQRSPKPRVESSSLSTPARTPARQRGSFNFYLHDMGYGGGGGLPVGREDRQSICADPLKNFGDVPKCLLKRAEKYFSFEKPHLCEMSFIGRY